MIPVQRSLAVSRRALSLLVLIVSSLGLIGDPASAGAGAPGDTLWVAQYGGSGGAVDEARSMVVSPDGARVFVAGNANGGTSGDDYAVVAYEAATGATLWTDVYNGMGN